MLWEMSPRICLAWAILANAEGEGGVAHVELLLLGHLQYLLVG